MFLSSKLNFSGLLKWGMKINFPPKNGYFRRQTILLTSTVLGKIWELKEQIRNHTIIERYT